MLAPRNDGGYKRVVRLEREAKADAVYITVGRGKIARTEETGPFVYDVDAEGLVAGIEILSATKVLAPGDWKKPGSRASAPG